MKYIKVIWFNDIESEPNVLYSEIDSKGYEVRKVEIYKDGTYGVASNEISSKETRLGVVPIPSFKEIAEGGEFVPVEISKEEFEQIWLEAI